MVEKAFREGPQHIGGPAYTGEAIAVRLRYGASAHNLLNYLNADERRKGDCYWYARYGVIDCLYNVTAILENPVEKGKAYRKSGLKKTLDDLDEDFKQYAGQPDRQQYVTERRLQVEMLIRNSGFTLAEVTGLETHELWVTFGMYINKMR